MNRVSIIRLNIFSYRNTSIQTKNSVYSVYSEVIIDNFKKDPDLVL